PWSRRSCGPLAEPVQGSFLMDKLYIRPLARLSCPGVLCRFFSSQLELQRPGNRLSLRRSHSPVGLRSHHFDSSFVSRRRTPFALRAEFEQSPARRPPVDTGPHRLSAD